MNIMQKQYYQDMLNKGRLIPFFTDDNRLICFITYFITNSNTKDPWSMIEETPQGKYCYIDQLITDKHNDNPRLSYAIWNRFKEYVKERHPSVIQIRWRRHKGGKLNVYHKDIKE